MGELKVLETGDLPLQNETQTSMVMFELLNSVAL